MPIPHPTIDRLGVENVVKLLKFTSHDCYAVIGIDLNDLCALQARMVQCWDTESAFEREEVRQWTLRLGQILGEALQSNLENKP